MAQGKTTTIRVLLDFVRPTRGRALALCLVATAAVVAVFDRHDLA